MVSFIMFGTKGWQHVDATELSTIDEGLLGVGDNEMFITTGAQSGFSSSGLSAFRPGWGNRLNDLVTEFVLKRRASTSIAQDLFIQLGQDERRAMSTMNHGLIAQQRVREAVLAFNLLATGNTWKPAMGAAFPYRSRDWVEWCDTYIATMQGAARDIQPLDFKAARAYERATEDLQLIRKAFATSGVMGIKPTSSGGGCYIATSVYGSYGAPEVLVLRRWRDQSLARTAAGRGLVRVYYAASPTVVRAFGGRRWFSGPIRRALDAFVRHLAGRLET